MASTRQFDILLYQHELLRTRLRVREHYLGTVVKEVYENIGQMLSLIRIKLLGLHHDFSDKTREAIDTSGEMVGTTIRDLRRMCRLFYPEEEIIAASGFYRVLEQELQASFPGAVLQNDSNAPLPPVLTGENGLMVFGILLELFSQLETRAAARVSSVIISRQEGKTLITTCYTGDAPGLRKQAAESRFPAINVFDRAALLGGRWQHRKERATSLRRIILELPNEPST